MKKFNRSPLAVLLTFIIILTSMLSGCTCGPETPNEPNKELEALTKRVEDLVKNQQDSQKTQEELNKKIEELLRKQGVDVGEAKGSLAISVVDQEGNPFKGDFEVFYNGKSFSTIMLRETYFLESAKTGIYTVVAKAQKRGEISYEPRIEYRNNQKAIAKDRDTVEITITFTAQIAALEIRCEQLDGSMFEGQYDLYYEENLYKKDLNGAFFKKDAPLGRWRVEPKTTTKNGIQYKPRSDRGSFAINMNYTGDRSMIIITFVPQVGTLVIQTQDRNGNNVNEAYTIFLDNKEFAEVKGGYENKQAPFGTYKIVAKQDTPGIAYRSVQMQLRSSTSTISRPDEQVNLALIFDIANGLVTYQPSPQSFTNLPEQSGGDVFRFSVTCPKGGSDCTLPRELVFELDITGLNQVEGDVYGIRLQNSTGWNMFLDVIGEGLLGTNDLKVSLKEKFYGDGLQEANTPTNLVQDGKYRVTFRFVKLATIPAGNDEVFTLNLRTDKAMSGATMAVQLIAPVTLPAWNFIK